MTRATLAAFLALACAGAAPALTDPHPCPGVSGFTCSTLTVPHDHFGHVPGELHLAVAAANDTNARHGVLLFLTGGPGQPGAPYVARITTRLGAALAGYRLVMFDQRGTGAEALQCPALQRIMGSSDLTPPPAAAVKTCAREIGPKRRYFATADTVEDVDALRAALGANRLALDGVSYGTFVAERYALAHPNRVSRLVLDSVVPHEGADPFEVANMHSTARVLRAACRCSFDVAQDLATEVRRRHDGTKLLDLIVGLSVFDPTYAGVPQAIHAAAHGNTSALDALLARGSDGAPAEALSQGLHASALCADTPFAWGGPETPIAKRAPALARAAARLQAHALWPFDRATATGNGFVRQCLPWPPTPTAPVHVARDLPNVPTLLLAGDRDLSTPLAWAREEAAHAPGGRLVVVPAAGHSVQLRAVNGAGRRALADFLRR